MVRSRESDELSKPTYEACLSSQEELRHLLNKLIQGKRPLTPTERERFFVLIATGTLGEGSNTVFSVYINKKIFSMKSVEQFARWLADQDEDKVSIPALFGNQGSDVITIDILWRALLNHLYAVFPISLSKALSMSKEDTRGKQSDGYKVS
jgi:hypothetical protein